MARSLYRVPRGRRWGPARGQRAAPRLEGGSASAAQPAGQPETRQPGGPGWARCGCRKHAGSCRRSGVRQQRHAAERGPLAKLAAAPVSSGCGFSGDSRLTASPCPLACACRACGPPLATRTSRDVVAPWAGPSAPARRVVARGLWGRRLPAVAVSRGQGRVERRGLARQPVRV